jgi:predicted  nucleic acid-binding Zn-ribbon protein
VQANLGEDKAKLCAELESGHGQIDSLHRELEMIRQAAQVKDANMAEAENQLEKLRKQVKETEEHLRSENMFLRDQVTSEQFAKDTMEESLQGELSSARDEITILRHVRAELEREKEQKEKV